MGLSIQNEDVKSKEELQARGAPASHLIHDTKIWVTANDILKPLSQAITDGDIGAEVGVGSAYRHRSIAYGDGSTEELGLVTPPYLNQDGNTVLHTDYSFAPEDFIRVHVDKKEWIEYISDATTPESYWYREGSNKIVILGDHTAPDVRLEVQVMDGVDLPPILSSLYAGLDLQGEAYGYTDWSGSSSGINQIYVQGGKTHIEIDTTFTNDDYVFVYINNEYYLPFKLGITNSKYYTLSGNNTVILDDNYSTQSLSLYIAVFRGKFLQDELGNVCFQIGANLREYSVESPDETVWGLTATDNGEIVSESGSTQAPDPIRIYRDDNTLVALEVDNNGVYSIDDNPTAGIAFETITLTSPDGTAWLLGVSNDNEIYLDSLAVSSNKFCLQDSRGNIVHEIQKTPEGAIFKLQHFNEGELPDDPELVTSNTLLAIEQNASNQSVRLMQYNTFRQEWQPISGPQSIPVGEVRSSILPPEEFKNKYGEDWEIMDGSVVLEVLDYPELASKAPAWIDQGSLTRSYFYNGLATRYSDNLITDLDTSNVEVGQLVDTNANGTTVFQVAEVINSTTIRVTPDHNQFAAQTIDLEVYELVLAGGGQIIIPDHTDYTMGAQDYRNERSSGANHATAGTRQAPPDDFHITDIWAHISSLSRIYFAGNVNADDTIVNDSHIDFPANATYSNTYNSEQRATAYSQILSLYRRKKLENKYVKVK